MDKVLAFDFPGARNTDVYCWLDKLGVNFAAVDQGQFDWMPPPGTQLLVTAQAYSAAHINILLEARKRGIKTLLLADGILEFRNTYRNPANTPGSLFMPMVADKMACISRGQAARIESWGNPGRCEVVGLPMMDSVNRASTRTPLSSPFRILVATAQTPWFDEIQKEIVLKSLLDLRDVIQQTDNIEVWWRLAPQAAEAVGVSNHVSRFSDMKMDICIDHVDAVISTPSTLLLYPMLQGKPAVAIDYTRSPAYLQTAWTINAREHILSTLKEIQNPQGDKLWFQRQTLDDNLEWANSATERLGMLIDQMLQTEDLRNVILKTNAVNSTPQNFPELARFFKWTDTENRWEANYKTLFHKSESLIKKQLHDNASLSGYIKELLAAKDWLEQQYKNWKTEASALSAQLDEKTGYIKELEKAKLELDRKYSDMADVIKQDAAEHEILLAQQKNLQDELVRGREQINAMEQQAANQQNIIARLQNKIDRIEHNRFYKLSVKLKLIK